MASESFIDTFISFLNSLLPFLYGAIAGNVVQVILEICKIWFGAVGWYRHRVTAFLCFVVSGATGVALQILQIRWPTSAGPRDPFLAYLPLALGFVAYLFIILGLGLFAYRAKFLPPRKSAVFQP